MKRDMVLVGAITGAHGIRGEVKLRSFTADPAAIASYSPLETAAGRKIEIAKVRPNKEGFIAILKGVTDRNAAEALRGTEESRPRVTARWMMACFCSFKSAITFRFARIARFKRAFAQSRKRTIAACSSGGGITTLTRFRWGQYRLRCMDPTPFEQTRYCETMLWSRSRRFAY